MLAAGWSPADAVTLRTGVEIVGSVLFDHAYADAPVAAHGIAQRSLLAHAEKLVADWRVTPIGDRRVGTRAGRRVLRARDRRHGRRCLDARGAVRAGAGRRGQSQDRGCLHHAPAPDRARGGAHR